MSKFSCPTVIFFSKFSRPYVYSRSYAYSLPLGLLRTRKYVHSTKLPFEIAAYWCNAWSPLWQSQQYFWHLQEKQFWGGVQLTFARLLSWSFSFFLIPLGLSVSFQPLQSQHFLQTYDTSIHSSKSIGLQIKAIETGMKLFIDRVVTDFFE